MCFTVLNNNIRYRIFAQFSIIALIFLSVYFYYYITTNEIYQFTKQNNNYHDSSLSENRHIIRSILNTSKGEVREAAELFLATMNTGDENKKSNIDEIENDTLASFIAESNFLNINEIGDEELLAKVITTTPRPNSIAAMYKPGHFVSIPDKCAPNFGENLELLILIMSAPSNIKSRDSIRLTWGHFGQRNDMRIVFIMGDIINDNETERHISNEENVYGDIIRGNFIDTYSNLPLKVISGFEWISNYCSRVKFVLKTDDDMFINVPRLYEFIKKHYDENNVIFGRLANKWKTDRNIKSKYYIPEDEFGGRFFPDFTTGPAYLMSNDVIKKLYDQLLEENFMRLEDIFITGVVAQKLNIKRKHSPLFINQHVAKYTPCKVIENISFHHVSYSDQFDLWKKLLDGLTKCY